MNGINGSKLIAKATSTFTGSKATKLAPVNIKAFGDVLKLTFQDSDKYAGLLSLPALSRLLEEFTVKLTATLIAPQSRPSSQSSNKDNHKVSKFTSHECTVRIIVYGVLREKDAVANSLSEAGLYLQHPSPAECDRQVPYFNPQYLLRPGAQMPRLEELPLSANVKNSAMSSDSSLLDEANKSRLMQIFNNSANGVGASFQVEPSPRLRSTLKE